MKHIVVLLFFILISISGFSQSVGNTNDLALEYFQKREFEKAAAIYQELYESTQLEIYFNYLSKCYVELKDYKTAEKIIKKRIKTYPSDLKSYVLLGSLYGKMGNKTEETKQYKLAINNIKDNEQQVIGLADAFVGETLLEYAELSYQKGRKLFKDYGFYNELAKLYQLKGNYAAMFNEYLILIELNEDLLEQTQSKIQSIIVFDTEGTIKNILKEQLLIKVQQKSDVIVFYDLLIWLFIQEKDFSQALVQAIALDKRLKGNGDQVFDIGLLAVSNADYAVGQNCFTYIINKGAENEYYKSALVESLSADFKIIISSEIVQIDKLQSLLLRYEALLNKLGISSITIKILEEFINLQAYYLNAIPKAVEMITVGLAADALSVNDKDRLRLLQGDIAVLNNEIWEATLIFAKVEKAHANDPLGYEAKFKRAKCYYYIGEFDFAKSMLDILKAGTSKLISNDAFELSSLINDNTALDTTMDAMTIFARADLLLFQKKDSLAMVTFDSIPMLFPGHTLEDEIIFKKAQIARNKKQYKSALELYKQVEQRFSYDIYADDACFAMAEIYDYILNDKETAMEYYRKIMANHQDSIYISLARKRYRELKDGV